MVIGVAAYHLRAGRFVAEGTMMLAMAFGLLTVLVPLQMLLGDLHGLNTLEHQPAKLAAIEANWETQRACRCCCSHFPTRRAEANRFEIAIPKLGSLILTHDADGEVKGLKDFPPRRPAAGRDPVLFASGIMVGIGVRRCWRWCCAAGGAGAGGSPTAALVPRLCELATPLGFVAVIAGWVTTEVGRQPWAVYGLLRTADAVTPSLAGGDVCVSLAVYVVVYFVDLRRRRLLSWCAWCASGRSTGRRRRRAPRSKATPARPLSAAEVE